MLQKPSTGNDGNKFQLLQEFALFSLYRNRDIISRLKYEQSSQNAREMLYSIWRVESAWFSCMQGIPERLIQSNEISWQAIAEGLEELSNRFSGYIVSLNETQMEETVTVYIPGIIHCQIPRHKLLQICFDQSNQYREQLERLVKKTGLTGKNTLLIQHKEVTLTDFKQPSFYSGIFL